VHFSLLRSCLLGMMWSSAFCRTFHNVESIELIVLDCFALFVYDMLESERSSYLSHLFCGGSSNYHNSY
jgi:hypothetical protein